MVDYIFKNICNQIKNQELSYDNAYSILKEYFELKSTNGRKCPYNKSKQIDWIDWTSPIDRNANNITCANDYVTSVSNCDSKMILDSSI